MSEEALETFSCQRELRRRSTRSVAAAKQTPPITEKRPKHEDKDDSMMDLFQPTTTDIEDFEGNSTNGLLELEMGDEVNAAMVEDGEIDVNAEGKNIDLNNPNNMLNYYTCHQCNKFFWTENSLRHHGSLCHSEKSFQCETCGKGFRFRSNLAEHRSVHTSIKPYVCKYCGKSSRLKGNLTKHILKHHKQETDAVVGKEDIIIKKGKKSVKDPKAIDFLEKSMIVLTSGNNASSGVESSKLASSKFRAQSNILNRSGNDARQQRRTSMGLDMGMSSASSACSTSVQNSVDAIIEKALASSANSIGMDGCLPVENNFGSMISLLESSLKDGENSLRAGSHTLKEETIDDQFLYASDKLQLIDSDESDSEHTEMESSPANMSASSIEGTCSRQSPRHETIKSSQNQTQCRMCGKHFRKSTALHFHMQSCHLASTALPQQSLIGISTSVTPMVKMYSTNRQQEQTPFSKTCSMAQKFTSAFVSSDNASSPPEAVNTENGKTNGRLHTSKQLQERIISLASCQKDIQDIKGLLQSLHQSSVYNSSQKVDAVLVSLDSRVARIERQMEATLNTLGNLVKMQTTMNAAFQQFRAEMNVKLQSLFNEIRAIGTPNGTF